jgi:hypothetical protein
VSWRGRSRRPVARAERCGPRPWRAGGGAAPVPRWDAGRCWCVRRQTQAVRVDEAELGGPPPALGEPGHELVRASGGVDADQGSASPPVPVEQLGQGELSGGNVIGRGVASRVTRPQQPPPAPPTRPGRGRRTP